MFTFANLTAEDVDQMTEHSYPRIIEKATNETLHKFLEFPTLSRFSIFYIVHELLKRHQFTPDDFNRLKSIVIRHTTGLSDDDYEEFFDSSYERSNQRVVGMDLTENDIHHLVITYLSSETEDNSLWARYIITDRFQKDSRYLRSHIAFTEFLEFAIDDDRSDMLADLANVNQNFAAFVYGKVAENPELVEKITPKLNSRAEEIFLRRQILEKLPPHQKRWHPEVPRLQELSYVQADRRKVAEEEKYIPNLRPW